ncbi:quinone oxidoreductase-like protein 2 homolog [Aplysia californica]|uniref:Quinone oxidoreductase-like protein 2 homolog n=1 Tax=Aplysia californica TaxID=6500 RepID=A0ABM0JF35_APLCA|nr:quinone oxidoreductase-like protein 2 homolog [Aplysia californica]
MAFQTPPEVLLRQCLRACNVLKHNRSLLSVSPIKCSARTYKAAVCTKLGHPMEIRETDFPSSLGASEVLLSVHGNGINFADILSSKGQYQMKVEPPFVPGSEIAGKVVEVGSGVNNVKKGDRVFCILGTSVGGASEYCVADCQGLIPVPDNLSLVEAAATIVNYGTAMMALNRKAKLKKRERVLVTAAAGATGLAITDIAKNMFDCEVIAVCGGQDKCNFLLEHGAAKAIDYTKESIRDKVKEYTGGQGVNVVMDQVGGDTLLECIKSMGFEGRAVTIGYASGKIPSIPANILLLKSASLIGVFWGSYSMANPVAFYESITQVLQGVGENKLRPYVGQTFPLDQVNEAYQYILDRKSMGKVVIKMKEEDHPAEL